MIRYAVTKDLAPLTALCLRAKAHWGYDAEFMAAVVDELTLLPEHLGPDLACWDDNGKPLAVARISVAGTLAELEDLFVDPGAMRRGLGRKMFAWACGRARIQGALTLGIDSDPFAEPFYLTMGAVRIGESPSGSIPGRLLPRLEYPLAPDRPNKG